jgi:hypothetical protein
MNLIFLGNQWSGSENGVFHRFAKRQILLHPEKKWNISYHIHEKLTAELAIKQHLKECIGQNPDCLILSFGCLLESNPDSIATLFYEFRQKIKTSIYFIPTLSFSLAENNDYLFWKTKAIAAAKANNIKVLDFEIDTLKFWDVFSKSENIKRSFHDKLGDLSAFGQEWVLLQLENQLITL